jgi:hypothetical protein
VISLRMHTIREHTVLTYQPTNACLMHIRFKSLCVGFIRSCRCLQARFNVEIEIVLPRDMTVQESHDLSLELQHKVCLSTRPFCEQSHNQREASFLPEITMTRLHARAPNLKP